MGERYLVTGAQLGLLQSLKTELERKECVEHILKVQFVGRTENHILKDVKAVRGAIALFVR